MNKSQPEKTRGKTPSRVSKVAVAHVGSRELAEDSAPESAGELSYRFTSELFVWSGGQTNWYFIRMPVAQSKELREQMDGITNGFGSIRVEATIEESTWRTSVFPESTTGRYMLPVKKQIRKAAEIEEGDPVEVFLSIVHGDPTATRS
jgi:Domain of unknown function (DUF1905)